MKFNTNTLISLLLFPPRLPHAHLCLSVKHACNSCLLSFQVSLLERKMSRASGVYDQGRCFSSTICSERQVTRSFAAFLILRDTVFVNVMLPILLDG